MRIPLPDAFPTLDAGDFTLRRIMPQDAGDFFRYLSDREVTALTSSDYSAEAEVAGDIRYFDEAFRSKNAMRWAIAPRDGGAMIGDCGYNHFDWRHHKAVIGYRLAKEYWGRGIVPQAVNSMLRWGFEALDLNRIEATTNPRNTRSARVLEKLGFQLEGTLREYHFARDAFEDCLIWGLVRREWTGDS